MRHARACARLACALQLREVLADYPVVFLPSHRSYADFILISYVCFHYDLPLPFIAAAMGE